MGATPREDHQPDACQSRQASEAAAMVTLDFFTYTDEQRDNIKRVVRKLGHDADRIVIGWQQYSIGGTENAVEPHRDGGDRVSSARCRQRSKSAPR